MGVSSTSAAMEGSQPNLRDNGHSAPTQSERMRQNTCEPGVARAYALGVRLYAVDCKAEVEKVARVAPGSQVFCRILSDCVGAEWPLSRKFGCEPAMAADVLEHAHKLGLVAHGISFHVGSQQNNVHAWDRALASAAAVFRECGERGMNLSMVNLGGGFPTKYLKNVPTVKSYGSAIFRALRKHFGNRIPETIIEPGRGMVGNAGIIEAEVVLVSKKSNEDEVAGFTWTWVSSAAWPRPWTSRSATRSAPRGTATRWDLASWPARPATAPTCSTRRCLTISRSAWRSATRC